MKKIIFFLLAGFSLQSFAQATMLPSGQPVSQTTLFDNGWRFHRGGAQGAEMMRFDDSGWRKIDLPHDWSIEDLSGSESPFDPGAISQVSGGFTVGGTGWYRKTFTIPPGHKDKTIRILFEGIYMNAFIWLNGELLGNHPYGYTSFRFDLSGKIRFGEENVLAVKVMNEGQNSRWYTGSGIYRHVWLTVQEPVHVAPWGISVTTPQVSAEAAKVHVKTRINNHSAQEKQIRLVTRILDGKGDQVAGSEASGSVEAGGNSEFSREIPVIHPRLWSVEDPALYTAVTEVFDDVRLIDRSENRFGIRSISFSAEKGFQLNGKSMKLKGGCVHHDNGPLGAKAYDRAEERRVELLKASGFNAIRCAHNPPSPAFLDACDRLGMLVIDEAFDMWRIANNPHDYHLYFDEWWQKDIESMVLRDRNHPCVILWSIGNEIRDMETPPVIAVSKMLGEHIRKLDPARPVTAAVNGLRPAKDPFFATLDIGGYNYASGGDHLQGSMYPIDHERVPGRIMVGTESYPLEAFSAWMDVLDYNYLIGDFVWTGFDYIGEASIGWRGYWQESNFYPWNLAYCGDIDICGWKRPQSFYRDALWMENKISIFVKPPTPSFPENPDRQSWSKWHWHDVVADWNWPGQENKLMEVVVYSSCETTELFLNSGERIPRRLCRGVSEQRNKEVLDGIGFLAGSAARSFNSGGPIPSRPGREGGSASGSFKGKAPGKSLGKSLGKKKTDRSTQFMAIWQIPYQPGELTAIGYQGKKAVAMASLKTAGESVAMKLTPDRSQITADNQDLSYVTIELTDQNGIRNPKEDRLLTFNLEGPGSILAVGNANPVSLESYQLPRRKAWQGKCLVVVKSTGEPGEIRLTVKAPGLPDAEAVITSR